MRRQTRALRLGPLLALAAALSASLAVAQPPQPGPAEALRDFLTNSEAWSPTTHVQSTAEHLRANALQVAEVHKARMVEVTGMLKTADGASLPISFSELTSGGTGYGLATRSGKALADKVDDSDGRPTLRVGLQIAGQSFVVGPFRIEPARTVTAELPGGHSVTLTWTLRALTEPERAEAEQRVKAMIDSEEKAMHGGADASWAPLSLTGKNRPDAIRQAGAVAGLSESAIDQLIADKYAYPAKGPTSATMQAMIRRSLTMWPPLGPADEMSQGLAINRMMGAFIRSDGKVGWIYYDVCAANTTQASVLMTGDQFVYRIVRQGRQFHFNAAVQLADGQLIEVPPTNFAADEIKRIAMPGGHILALKLTNSKDAPRLCPPMH